MANQGERSTRIVKSRPELSRLADLLGDSPEMVIPGHALRLGLCRVAIVGTLDAPSAVVIQAATSLTEPFGWASNPVDLWQALQLLEGWDCVNVALDLVEELRALMEPVTGPLREVVDICYTLPRSTPVAAADARVRRLTTADRALIAASGLVPTGGAMGSIEALVRDGYAAGAQIDGSFVSIAYASAFSVQYADIGVETADAWRNQGLATAAAVLVVRLILDGGRTPVWSTSADNWPSQGVAQNLGFIEDSARKYLVLQR